MPQEVKKEISCEIQKLEPSALIELFVLEMKNPADNLHFYAGTNALNKPVVWQGVEYIPLPIEARGFDMNSKGTLPRPEIIAANVQGLFTALVRKFDDLVGLRLIRKRTFAKYLDAVNFPEGNPTANPNAFFPDDIWFIDKKKDESKLSISWELASAFDLQGVRLPKRQIIQNYCQWKYRGGECGYTGLGFDINDKPCMDQRKDVCAKRLTSCRVRFQSLDPDDFVLPFGGFPGATRKNG